MKIFWFDNERALKYITTITALLKPKLIQYRQKTLSLIIGMLSVNDRT